MAKFLLTLTISVIISLISQINGHHDPTHLHNVDENEHGNFTLEQSGSGTDLANSNGTRSKRNVANGTPESLLASCQLTNLLLYQALQQQRQVNSNPLLALATSNLQGLGSNLNLNNLGQVGNLGGLNPQLLNPLAGINQNVLFPSLHTYTTTSTFVTKMTTTALITIPLLFGNRPSPTTVTRTKTYDVTTSEVKTLTSTIQPTLVVPQIKPTPTAVSSEGIVDVVSPTALVKLDPQDKDTNEYDVYEDPDVHYHNDVQEDGRRASGTTTATGKKGYLRNAQDTSDNVRTEQYTVPTKVNKARGTSTTEKKRRKSRPTSDSSTQESSLPLQRTNKYTPKEETKPKSQRGQTQYQYQSQQNDDYSSYGTGATNTRGSASGTEESKKKVVPVQQDQFYNRQYGSIQDDDVPIDEDPAAAQYPDDYSYYARRLKRGEQSGDEDPKLDREYLLEPSYDGDYSGNYQKYEKCPPIPNNLATTVTVTSTETRTITKFLKGQSSPSSSVNYYANAPLSTTTTGSRSFTPTGNRSRGTLYNNKRRDSADTLASTEYPTTYPERTTGDPRAQILRRGRARYNPSQDYEYYNNRG